MLLSLSQFLSRLLVTPFHPHQCLFQWMQLCPVHQYLLVYTSHPLLIFEHSQEILHETLISNEYVSWIDIQNACGRACTGMASLLCGL